MLKKVFITVIGLTSWYSKGDAIRLRADFWCPFNCEPKGAKPGYMIEVADLAFKAAGHTVDYETLPWARAVSDTREGKFEGVVGAARGDAEDFVFPKESLGRARSCFFTKKSGSWKYEGLPSLSKVVLGAIKDYSYSEDLDKYIADNAKDKKKVDVVAGNTPLDSNLKKLEKDRIGTLVEEESVLFNFMATAKMDVSTVKNVGCVKDDEIYIAFTPKDKAKSERYAKIIGDQVTKMRKDGSLSKLLEKYGLKDWKSSGAQTH